MPDTSPIAQGNGLGPLVVTLLLWGLIVLLAIKAHGGFKNL